MRLYVDSERNKKMKKMKKRKKERNRNNVFNEQYKDITVVCLSVRVHVRSTLNVRCQVVRGKTARAEVNQFHFTTRKTFDHDVFRLEIENVK